MLQPGDVVVAGVRGAAGTKRRPTLVVSTDLCHEHHPDVVLGVLTTRTDSAGTPADYVPQDWAEAGLHTPSAFRAYVGTHLASAVRRIGHLSERDWREVQARLGLAIAAA